MTEINIDRARLQDREIKVCPVVLRHRSRTEILLFEHPAAGIQLVKGTLEAGEVVIAAALRELEEESGLDGVKQTVYLGDWASRTQQSWHFVLCEFGDRRLPESWTFDTLDGGGHRFRFFWFPVADADKLLAAPSAAPTHPVYQDAVFRINEYLLSDARMASYR